MVASVATRRSLFAAAAALCAATPAAAQTYYADGPNAGGSAVLPIQVKASVGGRCGFVAGAAPSGSYDAGAIDVTAFSHQFDFQLDCNGPSRVAVVSQNGGLLTAGSVASGYIALAPYTVDVNLVGGAATATGSCTVATLAAASLAPCTFRGPASTAQGLRLNSSSVSQTGTYLRVSAPAYAGPGTLIAGTYSDTLTVTVSAAP